MDYYSGSGRVVLFPNAVLELCAVPCAVQQVQTTVSVRTDVRGCDRDQAQTSVLRKMCGKDLFFFLNRNRD